MPQWKIITLEETASTNDHLQGLLQGPHPPSEGLVITAALQSRGRGHQQNTWESEKGKNLLMSVLLQPKNLPASELFFLNMCICLAVHKTLEKHAVTGNLHIKWPNDIYLNNKKIAGILCENTLNQDMVKNCVAGMGINVNQQRFIHTQAISLFQVLQRETDLQIFCLEVLESIRHFYTLLNEKQYAVIRNLYVDRLWLWQTPAPFEDKEGKFTGRITGIDQWGRLLIQKEDGTLQHYQHKEVSFLYATHEPRH